MIIASTKQATEPLPPTAQTCSTCALITISVDLTSAELANWCEEGVKDLYYRLGIHSSVMNKRQVLAYVFAFYSRYTSQYRLTAARCIQRGGYFS
jgi:hypothetical protein